jgi:hypothetical protein
MKGDEVAALRSHLHIGGMRRMYLQILSSVASYPDIQRLIDSTYRFC